MRYRIVPGVLVWVALLMIPVSVRAWQENSQGEIPSQERNEVSERERNLGTDDPAVTHPGDAGEITGARAPGSLPETPIRRGISWSALIGGVVLGGILGFLIGRASSTAIRAGSRDRAA